MTQFYFRLAIATLAVVVTLQSTANAQGETPAPYDCANISLEGHTYNISAFKANTYTIKGEVREEHPNKIRVDYELNPCQAIAFPEGEAKSHCKAGTWVCQDTKLVRDEGEPITVTLRPIARDVAPTVVRAEKIEDVKELPWNLTLRGGNIDGQNQSATITFICDMAVTDETVGPTLTKYENGVVYFSWKSGHACPQQIQVPTTEGMGGFRTFLTVLSIFALIYLIAGAAYNHKVYGATGVDMIPHVDFWRDFPNLVVDVVRHVWDSVTGRFTSSRGYVSV
ncbi:hypothetical protein BX616_001931 [Lobosporangium transversale]|uniref:Autophagy-related protein 27 n=1 Tax=Lobosporangium transversale TaxID=64571 RepID=A0A1Y2GD98_9FUNG|nr:autophagy-related protein 27 [Lobosporangium transversale]KAF9917110.1 hypothetical protein BX616_001931 [Lobosporangium transversale]ORZ05891.1 autophagy-related protein 27 [Lobosporangium transversale]|eukprot:XP_021877272.1 autophagy-related protein 27 [Lobosporangium transversale]